jgi:hypothetical protein
MPPPEGARDLPYWFQESQYKMDVEALRRRVPEAKLVLGDIQHNIGTFLEEYDPSPIGAIFNDTDYWSSTRESFRLFDQASTRPQNFLPRQFLYFDDIIGREYEMYGPFNGQLLAIDEYNAAQDKVRIHRNQNLTPRCRPALPHREGTPPIRHHGPPPVKHVRALIGPLHFRAHPVRQRDFRHVAGIALFRRPLPEGRAQPVRHGRALGARVEIA